MHVHLTPEVFSTPFAKLHGNMGVPVWHSAFQSPHFRSHTLVRMCTYISTGVYVQSDCLCLLPPLNSFMETWVLLFGTVCVPSYPTSGPKPWLECVHVSVNVFMSTWLPMSASHHYHTYMQTWVLLGCTVCVLQSSHFCPHTLVQMCKCISTCICIHLTPCLLYPYVYLHGNMGSTVCVRFSHSTAVPALWLECVHALVHVFMSTWLHVCSTPYA